MSRNDRVSRWGLMAIAVAMAVTAAVAQDRAAQEQRREQWQRVDEIFEAMEIRAGSIVADVGAGDGFFTVRLAAAVGPTGRVYAVDISDEQLARRCRRSRTPSDGCAGSAGRL